MATKLKLTMQAIQHRENRRSMLALQKKTGELEIKVDNMESKLSEHAETTRQIKEDTQALIDIFRNAKTGAKAITFAAKFAKYVGLALAGLAITWSVISTFKDMVISVAHGH